MSTASDISPASTTPVHADGSGEWEERTLCPDDSCIGVLGPDGRCCLCGLRGDLSRPHRLILPNSDVPATDGSVHTDAPATDAMGASSAESQPAHDEDAFSRRELCPNDSCIGVLSAEGICPLCQSRRP
ncbi:MAG TPA: hypothetical protein PKI03_00410 [Pseudomonadota bacterium]|nr:hypothetical protein [Pseudomonadota bacterium]